MQMVEKVTYSSFSADIDLSDESGNIKFLRDAPYRYANEVLSDRESLILLRVESECQTAEQLSHNFAFPFDLFLVCLSFSSCFYL